MPSRRTLSVALAAFVVVLLAVAGWWVTRAPGLIPVTVRTSPFLVSAPILVADAFGDFADQGLAVRVHLHDTGRQALAAMIAERHGYATAADTPLMRAACAGQRFTILATIGETRDGVQIVARRDAGIDGPADLAGKRLATTPGTNAEFYLRSYLTMHGIEPPQARIRELPPEETLASLIDGTSDAVCLWEPYLTTARTRLGERALVLHEPSLYQFNWNLVRGHGPGDPAIERRMLLALTRAAERIEHDPEVRRWIGARLGIAEGDEAAAVDSAYFRPHLNHGLITGMEDQARVLLQDRGSTVDFSALIDPSTLLAIDPNAVRLIR